MDSTTILGVTGLQEPEPSLEHLMARYVDGDLTAFDALHRYAAPRILSYLLRLTQNRERAEDLLQITFIKIHRARSSYFRGSPFLPWAFAIARRSFYDERRSARARREDLSSDGTLPEPREEQAAIPTELGEALDRALDAMHVAYRQAIELTKFSDLSIAEAAEALGSTEAAVKLRVHRGYVFLRKQLDEFRRQPA